MLETRALVVEIDGEHALVEVTQANGCSQCNGKGCGSGKVAQMFCSKPRLFRVKNPIQAQVGTQVIVSAPDGVVLRGVMLVYLLPLLLMLLSAFVCAQVTDSEPTLILVALSGLLLGFVFSRWLAGPDDTQRLPVIARFYEA